MKHLGKKMDQFLAAVTFAEVGEHETARNMLRGDRSIVAAITTGREASPVLAYAIGAAERNNATLDVLFIGDGGQGTGGFSTKDRDLVRKAAIPVRMSTEAGTAKEVLARQAHRDKGILFFVTDAAALAEGAAERPENALRRFVEELGKPIVHVESHQQTRATALRKERTMSSVVSGRKKPVVEMFVMGLISIALYTLLLTNQDLIIGMFGKGGWYALLPIIVAFVFSFVHGAFTGDFWTVLGVEAARKKVEVK